jgi:hypothetical protein
VGVARALGTCKLGRVVHWAQLCYSSLHVQALESEGGQADCHGDSPEAAIEVRTVDMPLTIYAPRIRALPTTLREQIHALCRKVQCDLEDVSESREDSGHIDISWHLAGGAFATLQFVQSISGCVKPARVTLWLKPAPDAGAFMRALSVFLCATVQDHNMRCARYEITNAAYVRSADRGVDDVFAHLMAHCMQLRVSDGILQKSTIFSELFGSVDRILSQYRTIAIRIYEVARDVTHVTLDMPLVGRVRWDWRGSISLQMICLQRAVKVSSIPSYC